MVVHIESQQTWQPLPVGAGIDQLIRARVLDLALRLQDPSQVLSRAASAARRSRYNAGLSEAARLRSLALGPAGIALLFDELDLVWPTEGWHTQARVYLARTCDYSKSGERPHCGLLSGAAGLLYMAHRFLRNGSGQDLWDMVAGHVFTAVGVYNFPTGTPSPEVYDLASGAVGIGVPLLSLAMTTADLNDRETLARSIEAERYLKDLVHHLAWLAQREYAQDVGAFAHWYRSSPYLCEAQARWQAHEHAYRGYGMRQGLAGLIALMSLILESDLDIDEEETAEALRKLCVQVRHGMVSHEWRWWPLADADDSYHRPGACDSVSWCNGASGIARALWLAGRALGESDLSTLALECAGSIGQSFRHDPRRLGPSLCHGLAGLLQVHLRFANETGDPTLTEDAQAMTARLLDLFEQDRPFGYRTCEPEYIRVDSPWLLDGTPGIALALLSAIRTSPPDWDRILLLS